MMKIGIQQPAIVLMTGLLSVTGLAFAQGNGNQTSNKSDNIELPDFTRTYGFDIRPDVRIGKGNGKPNARKSFSRSLKRRFQRQSKSGSKYGLQRYTKYTGSRRFGFGVTRKFNGDNVQGITVHGHGVSFDRRKGKFGYYIGVDTRSPYESHDPSDDKTYMFFGIKARW